LSAVVKQGLRERGVRQVHIVRWSGPVLTEASRAVRARITGDKLSLPDDPDLRAEMLRVRERTRGGQPALELPRTTSNHCDRFSALALAVLHLERRPAGRARTWSSFKQLAGQQPVTPKQLDERLGALGVM